VSPSVESLSRDRAHDHDGGRAGREVLWSGNSTRRARLSDPEREAVQVVWHAAKLRAHARARTGEMAGAT